MCICVNLRFACTELQSVHGCKIKFKDLAKGGVIRVVGKQPPHPEVKGILYVSRLKFLMWSSFMYKVFL